MSYTFVEPSPALKYIVVQYTIFNANNMQILFVDDTMADAFYNMRERALDFVIDSVVDRGIDIITESGEIFNQEDFSLRLVDAKDAEYGPLSLNFGAFNGSDTYHIEISKSEAIVEIRIPDTAQDSKVCWKIVR